jgi:hypothetical protein
MGFRFFWRKRGTKDMPLVGNRSSKTVWNGDLRFFPRILARHRLSIVVLLLWGCLSFFHVLTGEADFFGADGALLVLAAVFLGSSINADLTKQAQIELLSEISAELHKASHNLAASSANIHLKIKHAVAQPASSYMYRPESYVAQIGRIWDKNVLRVRSFHIFELIIATVGTVQWAYWPYLLKELLTCGGATSC